MTMLRYFAKRILMELLYYFLEIWALLFKRKIRGIKSVGILFFPRLGMGDLIMLSPAIQKIAEIFSAAEITLVTWVPDAVEFKKIKTLDFNKAKDARFDLVISPTLNIHHIKYIFSAKYWVGYFSKSTIQSNFAAQKNSYNQQDEHYLWRGVQLIKSLDQDKGSELERQYRKGSVIYPSIACHEPALFKTELFGKRYAAVGVFLKFEDRQWSLEKCAALLHNLLQRGYFERIVLIGDSSEHNRKASEKIIKLLNLSAQTVLDATGKSSLKETSYLIKNSTLFFGLDSGPSHIAYMVAPKAAVIFITVEPRFRLPLVADISQRVECVYPSSVPPGSLYSGLRPVPLRIANKYMSLITVDSAVKSISKLMKP